MCYWMAPEIQPIAESLSRIDSFVESEGGIVLRCVRHEVFDAQIAKELDGLRRAIQNIEDRLLHAPDGSNAQLRSCWI
jgi:hypothetical protein